MGTEFILANKKMRIFSKTLTINDFSTLYFFIFSSLLSISWVNDTPTASPSHRPALQPDHKGQCFMTFKTLYFIYSYPALNFYLSILFEKNYFSDINWLCKENIKLLQKMMRKNRLKHLKRMVDDEKIM